MKLQRCPWSKRPKTKREHSGRLTSASPECSSCYRNLSGGICLNHMCEKFKLNHNEK